MGGLVVVSLVGWCRFGGEPSGLGAAGGVALCVDWCWGWFRLWSWWGRQGGRLLVGGCWVASRRGVDSVVSGWVGGHHGSGGGGW